MAQQPAIHPTRPHNPQDFAEVGSLSDKPQNRANPTVGKKILKHINPIVA